MTEWIRVARVDECPPGTCLERVADGRVIALYNVNGEFFALDGICPHQGGPLGKGCLEGDVVTCPWHGWQFCVRTGVSRLSAGIRQQVAEVRVDPHHVWVRWGISPTNPSDRSDQSDPSNPSDASDPSDSGQACL